MEDNTQGIHTNKIMISGEAISITETNNGQTSRIQGQNIHSLL